MYNFRWAQYDDCADGARLQLQTTDGLRTVLESLSDAASNQTKAELEEKETKYGWNHRPSGVLQHPRWRSMVDPIERSIFDFMHTWLVTGIFNVHVGYLLHSIKDFGYGQQVLDQYTKQFVWPARLGGSCNACRDMFSAQRYKAHWKDWQLKCPASQSLSILPVLTCLMSGAMEQGQPELDRHAACFLMLAQCIELIVLSARHTIDLAVLQQTICSHLKACNCIILFILFMFILFLF